MSNTTALAVVGPQPQALSLDEKMKMCSLLCDAPDMLPKHYLGKPGNVLVALELGRSLGIEPVVAMMEIYMVNNRPSMSARLMNALIRKAGHTITIASTPQQATCSITRRENPSNATLVTFSMEDAQAAGLKNKEGPWKLYPQRMLESRAIAACARLACPDIILGMPYTPEELGDDRAEFVDVLPAQVIERPAEEPGTTKAYSQIQTSEPKPRQRQKPPERPAQESGQPAQEPAQPAQEAAHPTATAPAEPAADDPPATEEARGQVMVAWKALYGFNPETGEKDAKLAQMKLADLFPGWSIKNATCDQLAKIMAHVEEAKEKLAQEAKF